MRRTFVNKFNRGEIDPKALMRLDVDKVASTGSTVTNWLPLRLGPMMYRPGMEYIGSVDGAAYFAPFIAATDDVAQLEFTDQTMRVWVDDEPITRPAVTTAITNDDFATNLSGWVDDSSGSGSIAWASSGGYTSVDIVGDGSSTGALYQLVTPVETGTEHAIRISINDAPCEVKIGESGAGSGDIFRGILPPGVHSLSFTPTGQFSIYMANRLKYKTRIDYSIIESAGAIEFSTPITESLLPLVRYDQSADIMYIATNGARTLEVQRRGVRSWSLVDFRYEDGPFGFINTQGITLAAAAVSGDTTLSASDSIFNSGHVGALFKLSSASQTREASVSAEATGTSSVRVTGVGSSRDLTVALAGTWSATVTLQRSTDDATWTDVESYTSNVSKVFNDAFDNSIFYYRLFVKTGNYTSGTVVMTLSYSSGSIDGICRVTSYTSSVLVNVQVLQDFGSTDATLDWYEGEWSASSGYPSAVRLFEGRLWWAGKDSAWGSVSDAYRSYDDSLSGDSASIRKSIGFGPSDSVNWLFSTNQLIMGIASDEIVVRSTSFGEAMTSLNTNLRRGTSQGSAAISPVQADSTMYFVQRSLNKIFEFGYSNTTETSSAYDTTTLNPSICAEGIKRIAVARQPETRLFAVLNDGTARVYLVDPAEEVRGWSRIETDGTIDDVVVMPGTAEDRVYFVVNRTNGRGLEKMALLTEAVGGGASKHFDSFVSYSSPGTVITGLSHLEGETVAVWADGQDRGEYTVASNQITVAEEWTDVVVGLRHTAVYRSNKLNELVGQEQYATVNQNKCVVSLGIVAENFYPATFQYGSDENYLQYLPLIEDGTTFDHNATQAEYDKLPFDIDSTYSPDSRVYLKVTGPATLLSMVYEIDDPDYTANQSR